VLRLIEQPADEGDVLQGQKRLGRVHYHLSIYQHFSEAPDGRVGGHLEAEGHVTPLDPFDLTSLTRRTELTLHLADGRCLEFTLADPSGTIRSTGRGIYTN
jgi:hypothetical protein